MIYQWLIAAITLLLPAYAGTCALAYTKIFKEKSVILSIGSIAGIALFGTLMYALAHVIPLSAITIWIILAIFLIGGSMLAWHGGFSAFKQSNTDSIAVGIFLSAFILFSFIGPKLLIEKPTGLYTGVINAYGDIGWHTALITELSEAKTLPVQDPIFAGTALTYPFLANLLSAISISAGSSLPASVNVPVILLVPLLLILLYAFGKIYGMSRAAGIVTVLLFLFGGAALGWTRVFSDFSASNTDIVTFLLHLPERDYSGVGTDAMGFHFLNPITSLLLPQRAMLFGLPLVLAVLILLHPVIMRRKYSAILAGILAGMLPLFHAHACIALFGAIIALMAAYPSRLWLKFIIPALIVGMPELLFYMQGNTEEGSFFRFEPWWMKGERNFFLYWFQNTFLLIPISIVALFRKPPRYLVALTISAIALFGLANTFLLAPWAWDNFKILVFWLLFTLPIVAWGCIQLWNHSEKKYLRPVVIMIIIVQTFSGALDIWKLAIPTALTWQEWDRAGIVFASYIKQKVPVSEAIATASVHNSPVVLAGRLMYLGYAAHVWSHGVTPWAREEEVKKFYAGEANTIAGEIPRYIVIGPQEKSAFPTIRIRPNWQKIAVYGRYELFSNF